MQTYPVDMAATFQRGGHGLFGTARDYFRFAQMQANGGELDGVRILSRKTLELMHVTIYRSHRHSRYMPALPARPCLGLGVGSTWHRPARPVHSVNSARYGAAKTYYWVDPVEQIVGMFMAQSIASFDLPELYLRAIAYGAIVDQNR